MKPSRIHPKKCNVEFYELINILGEIASNTLTNAKMFAQGLIVSYKKKKAKSFEKELLKSSNELRNNEINAFQFLNIISTSAHDNQLIDESWGLAHSRVDLLPEIDVDENDNSSESECVDSDESDVE